MSFWGQMAVVENACIRIRMKYAIMSDVHANPQALKTALADAHEHGCKKFIFAGDVTGYGYDAKTAINLVRENFDIVLMGNHDSACVGLESGWMVMANPNYDIDRAQREILDQDDIEWLRRLPYDYATRCFAVTHGDFTRPQSWNYIASTESAVRNFFSREEPLLFCGHTHHAMIWEATANGVFREKFAKRFAHPAVKPQTISFQRGGSRYIVNVGSVGYPRYDLCSCYAIYDSCTDKVIMRRLPFDFKSYVKAMLSRKMNLPGWMCSLFQLARSQS